MATVHLLTTADEQVAGSFSRLDFQRLVLAAASDRFQKHSVVESPDSAEIILFVVRPIPTAGIFAHIVFFDTTGTSAFSSILTIMWFRFYPASS
jgi:hypothetical protein